MVIINPRIKPNFESHLNVIGATKDTLDLRREKFPEELANLLKFYRISRHISIDDMADYLGIDTSEYSLLENGKLPLTLDDLICLCNILPWSLSIKEYSQSYKFTELEFVEEKK